ncbi:hypothetical protein ACFPMF_12550 [Larkinella bovis]|uniref:Uncharacterized protein n=1 Tax=Larkinella bovis TaxID=683041 RepID=A0ABW0ICP7_9BACT
MFDNAALDVAIGLIFIFLIYSLLASILLEIVAKMFSLRARNLVRALRRMLQDEPADGKARNPTPWTWLIEFGRDILYFFRPIQKGTFLSRFYEAPSIRYLGENSIRSKPSYIYPTTFSQTIVQLLRSRSLAEHSSQAGSQIPDSIKTALQTGEIKTSEALMHALFKTIDPTYLSAPFDSRMQSESEMIRNVLDNNLLLVEPDTLKQLRRLFQDARHDTIQFRILLERWFDETMQTAGAWYQRQAQILLIFIGFFLAYQFNVDIIAITKILSKDKKAREQLVQMAVSRQDEYEQLVDQLKVVPLPDTNQRKKLITRLDTLTRQDLAIKDSIRKDAGRVQDILGMGKQIRESRNDGTLWGKGKSWIGSWWDYMKRGFFGWALTALAVSLGAPFWYDLLSKLITVRRMVRKDEPNTPVTTAESRNLTIVG